MKLIFCRECQDVKKMQLESTYCSCGESWGFYRGNRSDIVIGGPCEVIGFSNSSLGSALNTIGSWNGKDGVEFTSFIIPRNCNSIERRWRGIKTKQEGR